LDSRLNTYMKLSDRRIVTQPETNELNRNANGGTELTTRKLFELLGPEQLDGVQIISSRVRHLEPGKKKIYFLHDLPEDPEASHLREAASRARFDKLVFVSNWQYQQYRNVLNIPYSKDHVVIENGVDTFEPVQKADPRTNPIQLIYTPTPHRGLELLVPAFEALAEELDYIELHVYSSFELYGWPERDAQYQKLFERCKSHPKIHYHGSQPNSVVREAYQRAHAFVYPSIWTETSCRCLIESMMSGCDSIHPNFGALPETSGGTTIMYSGTTDHATHAEIFASVLRTYVKELRETDIWDNPNYQLLRQMNQAMASRRFNWRRIIRLWELLLKEVKS